MRVRRAAARISTILVAIFVALAVPVSQLRTVAILKTCCCPDPAHCRCPDDKAPASQQPSLRACHNTERAIFAPELPAFRAPGLAIAPVPTPVATAAWHVLPVPHPAPPPLRPDAPS